MDEDKQVQVHHTRRVHNFTDRKSHTHNVAAPATHCANVRGDTIVMISLIALPIPRPSRTSRFRSRAVTVSRFDNLSLRMRFSAFRYSTIRANCGSVATPSRANSGLSSRIGNPVKSAGFPGMTSNLYTASGPAEPAILPMPSGIVGIW